MKLVVTQPFADYKVGDQITDATQVAEVIETHPGSVVKTADDPKPEVPTAASKSTSRG